MHVSTIESYFQGRIGKVEAVSGLEVVVIFDQTNAIEVRALFSPLLFDVCALVTAIVSDRASSPQMLKMSNVTMYTPRD